MMRMLTPKALQRNFLMGKLIRVHLLRQLNPSTCGHACVRGAGMLVHIRAELSRAPGHVSMLFSRLLLPFDLTRSEVKQHLHVLDCKRCQPQDARHQKDANARREEQVFLQSTVDYVQDTARLLEISLD